MRRILVNGLTAVALLLVPTVAQAEDDPPAPDWPHVQAPDGGSQASDPDLNDWPRVQPPSTGGASSDPQLPDWPAPTPL